MRYPYRARFLIILILLLVLVRLSACQRGAPEAATSTAGSSTRTSDPTGWPASPTVTAIAPSHTPQPERLVNIEPAALRGTIIHFWHPWTGETGQVIRSLVEEFNLNNPWEIVVVPVAQTGLDGIESQVAAGRQAGRTPDLVVGYLHQLLTWDQEQPLVDLQAYIQDPLWGYTQEEQADFTPVLWQQDLVAGRRLGAPFQRSAQVLYYNATWAQALGFNAPPTTPEQFRQQVCEAAWANRTDSLVLNTGGWIISTNYATALNWIYTFGGEATRSAGEGEEIYRFNTPEVDEAFAFLRDLYDTHCAWLSEDPYPEAEFARRLGLISTGSVMDIPYQALAFERAGSRDQWMVIPYPSDDQPALNVYGASLAIFPSSPEEQLAAWQLLRWLLEPRNHAHFVQASGSYPIRASELEHLEDYRKRYPQWSQALELIPAARPEPPIASWGRVRWALEDAFTQLFRSYFSIDQIPTMLSYLDRTANDLHLGPEKSGIYDTPTPTPTPSPERTPPVSATPTFTTTPRPSPGAPTAP